MNYQTKEREKLILSRALQKANTAVQLDRAQNFEGAIKAYRDANQLLQEVQELEKDSSELGKRRIDVIVSSQLIFRQL